MPEPLEREVIFDIAPALSSLEDLDRAFEQSATQLEQTLSDAVANGLSGGEITDVDATQVEDAVETAIESGVAAPAVVEGDAAAVESEVEGAIDAGAETPAVVEGDASEVETDVAAAIDAGAATPAIIEGDAGAVTAEIEGAVNAADSQVELTADGDPVTTEIESAVNAADTDIVVDADVSQAQDAIEGLEGESIEINVDTNAADAAGDLSGLSSAAADASSSFTDLGSQAGVFAAAAGAAAGDASGFASSISGAGTAAAAAGTGILALAGFIGIATTAAIEAETAGRRFNDQLGDFADEVEQIDIGGLNTDITELAIDLGSSDEAMRNAAASLAQLGTNAGASEDQIAATAEQVLALSARAVALNPALGEVGDVAANLSRALASGRDRALVPFGIALDKSAVAAEAQRLALAAGRTEINVYDKIVAGAAITTQKLGTTLGKDVAEGAASSELTIRSFRVQIEEMIEALGAPLVAPVIQILEAAVPIATAFGEILQVLALSILPALTPALQATAVVLGAVSDAIGVLPDGVVALAGAFAVLSPAIRSVQIGVGLLFPALGAAAGPIGLLVVALGAAALAFTTFSGSSRDAAAEAEATGTALFGQAESAQELASNLNDLNSAFDKYLQETADFGEQTDLITTGFEQLSLSNRDVQEELTKTGGSFTELAAAIVEASGEFEAIGPGLRDTLGEGQAAIEDFFKNTAGAQADTARAIHEVVEELEQEAENIQASARARLQLLVNTEQLTEAQRESAVATATSAEGQVNYFEALQAGTLIAAENVAAEERRALAARDTRAAFDDLRAAVIAGNEVDVEAFAAKFGVSVEEVQAQVDTLKAAVDEFVGAGLNALPTAQTAFDAFADGIDTAFKEVVSATEEGAGGVEEAQQRLLAALDPQRLIEQLFKNIAAIQNFTSNLRILLQQGATEAVEFLTEIGPAAGAGLAQSLVDQGPKVAGGVSDMLGATDQSFDEYEQFLRDEAFPAIEEENVRGATEATKAYDDNFNLGPGTEEETDNAERILGRPDVPNAADRLGRTTGGSFLRSFKLDTVPQTRSAAGRLNADRTVPSAAGNVASRSGISFFTGLNFGGRTSTSLGGARSAITGSVNALSGSAASAGSSVGESFGSGVAGGIESQLPRIRAAAQAAFEAARDVIEAIARISSPSLVFMELGAFMGEGLAIGIERQVGAVEQASQALVDAATAPFGEPLALQVAPEISGAINGGGAAAGQQNTFQFDVAITVEGAMTAAAARRAADQFTNEASAALLRRNIIASVRAG